MRDYLSELAKGLAPYVPGEQPKDKRYIKLNTNENPYPPSEKVAEAISGEIGKLRLYPDPETTGLREVLARYYGLEADQVFVGNGSDEVLAFAYPAFFTGGYVLFPDITYSFYPVYAGLFNTDYKEIPLRENFVIDPSDFLPKGEISEGETAEAERPAGILIPNPNAPTGRLLSLSELEGIIAGNPETVVLVDEAYVDFGGDSAACLVNKYDNLLVVMTLSKSRSLAGLRVGFALGSRALIAALNTVKNSFNSYTLDRLAQVGSMAAMADEAYFQETRNKIMATRIRVTDRLTNMGFQVIPSAANFIFASHGQKAAEDLFEGLRSRGILVRYFKKPLIANYLRITIGTDEEMEAFLKAIGELTN